MNMVRDEIAWSCPSTCWSLAEREVHVWAFALDVPTAARSELSSVLAKTELQRAERFRFERDRSRFVAGRAQLRHILGSYLQIQPAQVAFAYSAKGKPFVHPSAALSGLMFNLSHSDDLAVLALTRTSLVGVDLERIRTLPDADHLVSRFFSPSEAATFRIVPESKRSAAFFNLWTRKEAWLKATGEGIGGGLDRVEVSFLPGETPRFITLGPVKDRAANWELHEIAPAPGFVGAVAVAAQHTKIRCWQWPRAARLGIARENGP